MARLIGIIGLVLAFASGCDRELSRWDRISVTVVNGEPSAYRGGPLVVDAGADLLTNAVFEREAIVQSDEPLTYTWESTAGGELIFGSATEQKTSIAAPEDGTYTVRVIAKNEAGDEGQDEFQLIWDATAPATSSSLQTLAGSVNGPDVRITNQTTIVLSWGSAVDAIAGVRDYTLSWYDAAVCTGQETVVAGLTVTQYELTGANGNVFSYKVTATDELGQETTTACSPSITIDTLAPPALDNLAGAVGPTLASATLTLNLPADFTDYAQLTVRRTTGATAPADCTSGTLIKTLTAAQLTDPMTVTDVTTVAAGAFSYRVCITDQAGNLTSTNTAANVLTKSHYVFVSSTTMNGALGGSGIAGADQTCKNLAQASTTLPIQTEPNWRAILSTSTVNAVDRLGIYGKIVDSTEQLIANHASDFWDGTIQSFLGYDEETNVVVAANVWSGTLSVGGTAAANTCNNWTDGTAGSTAFVGDPGLSNAGWLGSAATQNCNTMLPIYCLSQF